MLERDNDETAIDTTDLIGALLDIPIPADALRGEPGDGGRLRLGGMHL